MKTDRQKRQAAGRNGSRRRAGFTVVELMVAALASTVLALTAGTLLFIANSALFRAAGQLEIQRDATFAMDILGRTVQSSRGREVTIVSGLIEFATNHVRTARVAFYSDGNGNLMYDPNRAVSGNEVKIVNGRLTSFTPSVLSNRVWFALGLRDGAKSLFLTNCLTFRNGI